MNCASTSILNLPRNLFRRERTFSVWSHVKDTFDSFRRFKKKVHSVTTGSARKSDSQFHNTILGSSVNRGNCDATFLSPWQIRPSYRPPFLLLCIKIEKICCLENEQRERGAQAVPLQQPLNYLSKINFAFVQRKRWRSDSCDRLTNKVSFQSHVLVYPTRFPREISRGERREGKRLTVFSRRIRKIIVPRSLILDPRNNERGLRDPRLAE